MSIYHLAKFTNDEGMPVALITTITGEQVARQAGPLAEGPVMGWALGVVMEHADVARCGWSDPYKSDDGTVTVWNLRPIKE